MAQRIGGRSFPPPTIEAPQACREKTEGGEREKETDVATATIPSFEFAVGLRARAGRGAWCGLGMRHGKTILAKRTNHLVSGPCLLDIEFVMTVRTGDAHKRGETPD